MPLSNNNTFPQFKRFPPEIRLMIWLQAHNDSKTKSAELCIINRPMPPTDGFPAMDPDQPCVDIPFPLLMYVCGDSRAAILSASSGARFRYSVDAKCNIPCRKLDPDLDTVYLDHSNFDDAMAQEEYFRGYEQRVQRVAINASIIIGLDDLKITRQVMPKFPCLREVQVVLESEFRGVRAQSAFSPPTTRFKLVRATPSGVNDNAREIRRWMLHLRLKVSQRQGPAMHAMMQLPALQMGMNGVPMPNLPAPGLPTQGPPPEFRPYVFLVPSRGASGRTTWKKYPRLAKT